jgi:amidase
LPASKLKGRESDDTALNAVVRGGDRVSESDNYLSSMTGLPGLLVPMGQVADGVPLSLEFLGRPYSEPTLIKLASGFEAQTRHRKSPRHTPALPGEHFDY